MKTYTTDYKTAVHWLHNSLIMCNNITDVDHWGTAWDYVPCDTDLENAPRYQH